MVRHVILWKLRESLSGSAREEAKAKIKAGLEALQGEIPGLLSIRVETSALDSSNTDLMLDSTFENADALAFYAVHPAHVKVKDEIVAPNVSSRACFDYEA